MLADHRQVVAINEPLIGMYLGPFMADLPGADPAALDLSTFTLRHVRRDNGHHFFAETFRDVWSPGLARLMLERFTAQAERQSQVPLADAAVVIKEPNGSQSADIIMETLPESRLLFLLRDGRDVVDSELAANTAGAWAVDEFPGLRGIENSERIEFCRQASYKWLWRTQIVEAAFDSHPGPKMLVKYEDLRADPRSHYRAIVDWIGLDVSDDELDAVLQEHSFEAIPESERGEQKFYRSAKPGGWSDNLTPQEQATVEKVIGAKLKELGYS